MKLLQQVKEWARGNKIPLILAVGLLLFIGHYQRFEYVPLFQIGAFILWFTVAFLIFNHWKRTRETGLGPKYIWIPLAVISGSAILRILIYHDSSSLLGGLFMASMFGLYIVSRKYGEKALSFFFPITIIGAVSIIIQGLITKTPGNAGLFNNYATASEFLVFGWVVSPRKYQWWLAAVVLGGLFFTGAPEAIFYVGVMGLVILIRKDWSKRILTPVGTLGLCFLIFSPLGITAGIWGRAYDMAYELYIAQTGNFTQLERDNLMNEALNQRWLYTWRLQRPVSPLGYGVDVTNLSTLDAGAHVQHNIIFLVTDQLGPVAAAAWLAMIIGGIRKTKWKYGYLSLILFGVFQPFVWTEMAPYTWCLNGAATSSKVDTSYIFKVVATT